jgi:hypothetical protein
VQWGFDEWRAACFLLEGIAGLKTLCHERRPDAISGRQSFLFALLDGGET